MSADSKIEWTESTWNPTRGCTKVSPGCDHCYAETFAERWRGIPGHPYEDGFTPRTAPDMLLRPLSWRRPRLVFVNSMSDLFHQAIPDDYIAQVFAVMAATPRHTYQVLTKRHGRMRSLLNEPEFGLRVLAGMGEIAATAGTFSLRDVAVRAWPLPNVWLGVSVEDQQRADLRIPALLDTPAAVRFLSCEPLLGPLDLMRLGNPGVGGPVYSGDALRGGLWQQDPAGDRRGVDWVIAGGESGPGARPMHPQWVRDLRDACDSAGVPFFFKQWGAWAPSSVAVAAATDRTATVTARSDGTLDSCTTLGTSDDYLWQIGKSAAGRLLDGRTHDAMPERAAS